MPLSPFLNPQAGCLQPGAELPAGELRGLRMIEQDTYRPGRNEALEQVFKIKRPAWLKHAADFSQCLGPIGYVMKDAVVYHPVKTGVGRFDRLGIAPKNAGMVAIFRYPLLG